MAKYRKPSAAQPASVIVKVTDEEALSQAWANGWQAALDRVAPVLEKTKAGREALDAARQETY